MRFRRTLTFLILSLAFALPAGAQQKPVAPGLSPALAYVAASLPRHGGVKPPLRYAALKDGGTVAAVSDRRSAVGTPPLQKADLKVSAAMPGINPAKPFAQEQVVSMVRDGFGDESGAKLIEQRGIDFAPSEDFIQAVRESLASKLSKLVDAEADKRILLFQKEWPVYSHYRLGRVLQSIKSDFPLLEKVDEIWLADTSLCCRGGRVTFSEAWPRRPMSRLPFWAECP